MRWSLRGHDHNEFLIAVRRTHSPDITRKLESEIRTHEHRVLWDIGANIGGVALPLLARHKDLHAVMFEPDAAVAGRLVRNVAMNPKLAARADILTVALSEKDGLSKFYASNEDRNSGIGGLEPSPNRSRHAVWVHAHVGDRLIADGTIPAPDIIKVDVEGFELPVLKGLKQTLAAKTPTLLFEHCLYRLEERSQPKDEVVGFLEESGYRVSRIDADGPVVEDDLSRDTDFIARPA